VRDAMDAITRSMRWHADERVSADGEIVWSWSPGAETKSAMLMASMAGDGGKNAGPRGEHV
jgi:hypothetical protein